MRRPALLAWSLFVLATAGCGDDESPEDGEAASSCSGLAPLQLRSPVATTEGDLAVAIVDAAPFPPALGNNRWELQLTDASGAGVANAALTVDGWMPEHGHGLNAAVVVSELGGGRYSAEPINLVMPSVWDVRISIESGDLRTEALFQLCVPAN